MTSEGMGETSPILKAPRVSEDEKIRRIREKEEEIEERARKKAEEREEEEEKKEEEKKKAKTHHVEKCKHIPTLNEVRSGISKSVRPDSQTSVNGEFTRPVLGSITKSINPSPRMGVGVDPHKVVENDWNDYKLYMSRNKFN